MKSVYQACVSADIPGNCPRHKHLRDPLQTSLLHCHWQDASSDNGVAAGRGGGRTGWRKSQRWERDAGNSFQYEDTQEGRPHLVTSREGEGKLFMSGLYLWLPGDMGAVIQPWMVGPSLVKWVPVTFSVTGQRSKY